MFVSSYSTYISTNSSDKTNRRDLSNAKEGAKSFSLEPSKNPILKPYIGKNLPIDYVSNYKSFNNQQKLQNQMKSQDEINFQQIKVMSSAKSAYEENSKMFPLLKKPTVTFNQADKIDKSLPQDIQELKEENMRHIMVNTYLANDKYYQVTAA
ncbi:MAG: hypothetical protein L3J19_00745 [Sulfurimonas sp.]|nr:hypothetical protein [Sulfurimonas sp.]